MQEGTGPGRSEAEQVVRRFHRLYYESHDQTWLNTSWLGVRASKCPLDLWVYQEIIHRTKPDLVVETGTNRGGTTYFLATVMDLIGAGRIISIDQRAFSERPDHARVSYLTGPSTANKTVAAVKDSIEPDENVMVILDSDHSRDHVLTELRTYGPLVAPDRYLIVEDTNLNGQPVRPEFGPGPMEAVQEFLGEEVARRFRVDRSCEKFLLTFNPGGFLVCDSQQQ